MRIFHKISDMDLSTRAKNALAQNDIHTVSELRGYVERFGEGHLRTRMFAIGPITAAEILKFLDGLKEARAGAKRS